MKSFRTILAAALISALSIFGAAPVLAQAGSVYGKVEQPWYAQGKISGGISVSGTSAPTLLPPTGFVGWICNTGSNDAYLAFGGSSVTAVVNGTTGNGTWLKAGTCGNYDLFPFVNPTRSNYVAAITASSTTTLTVETGLGSGPQQLATSGGGGGSGTSSNFSSAFPTAGTAAGFSDGTNMAAARVTSVALADAFTPPTAGLLQQQAFLMGYNGATYDRLRVDASKNLLVGVLDGADVTLGAKADAACASPFTGSCSGIALLRAAVIGISSPIPYNVNGTSTAATALTPGVAQTGTIIAPNSDITSIGGIAVLKGAGATGTGSQRATVAQDTTTIAGSAPGTAGTPSANVVSVQGEASMTPVAVNKTQVNGTTQLAGTGATGAGSDRVTVATDQATNAGAALVKGGVGTVNGGSTWNTVAASQTAQVLSGTQGGGTGAVGDYLSHCVIQPTSTSPGLVTVFDGTNSATNDVVIFPGGASSVSNLVPFAIPVGSISINSGGWKVTTGLNVEVTCYGKFT